MANDAYNRVIDCKSCAAHCKRIGHQMKLRLFSATRPLQIMAMDIIIDLRKTGSSNQHVIVLTDQYFKRLRAILVITVIFTTTTTVLVDNSVIRYSIPKYLRISNALQLVLKFFHAVISVLGPTRLTTTAYHPRPTDQWKASTDQTLHTSDIMLQTIRPAVTNMGDQ